MSQEIRKEAEVNHSADEFDWDTLDDQFETMEVGEKTRIPVPVPESIRAKAQMSLDNGRDEVKDGETQRVGKRYSISFRGNLAMAMQFERHMKNAGDWTIPPSSLTVTRPNNGILVFWRASTARRGRKPGSTNGNKPKPTTPAVPVENKPTGAPADSKFRAAGGNR